MWNMVGRNSQINGWGVCVEGTCCVVFFGLNILIILQIQHIFSTSSGTDGSDLKIETVEMKHFLKHFLIKISLI